MLAGLAYEAVNRGREALPVAVILQGLKKEMQSAGIGGLSTEDVANWLVAKAVLLPYSGGRSPSSTSPSLNSLPPPNLPGSVSAHRNSSTKN